MDARLIVEPTPIVGVQVLRSCVSEDARGTLARLFCEVELVEQLGSRRIRQINLSRTNRIGAIRGLHYQNPPHAEMKIVRCLRGKVWDVAVDLRRRSPTFLQWHGVELFPSGWHGLVIPEGCAHGFQVLEPESELLYLHTAVYEPSAEGGIRYDDPALGIAWPLPPQDVSARDQQHASLAGDFEGIES
jgi:dTDP-4-dehydrorhamnose 3,5-epimerase